MSRTRIVALAFGFALASLLAGAPSIAEDVPYGSNDAAAHRLHYEDAQLYYEVYGEGPPVLLLHGGLYGYIDEFASYIEANGGSATAALDHTSRRVTMQSYLDPRIAQAMPANAILFDIA